MFNPGGLGRRVQQLRRMDMSGTILALATPPGGGVRSILRCSGPGIHDALRMLDPAVPLTRGVHAIRCRLDDRGAPLSFPTLASLFPAPRSYTGQDVLELALPTSRALVDTLSRALLSLPGWRVAEAGEFTARAFMLGRITLTQAEAVLALVAAATADELHAAHALRRADPGLRLLAVTEALADTLALLEAGIDFSDQESVELIAPETIHAAVAGAIASLQHEISPSRPRLVPAGEPLVVLAGAPNAGKTTLLNALLGRERGVVSPIAGTTRDAIVERLQLGDAAVRLADCAGIGEPRSSCTGSILAGPGRAGDSIERAVHEATQRLIESADVVVLCDPRGLFAELWMQDMLRDRRVVRVRTKADQPGPIGAGAWDIEVSARTGRGLAELRVRLDRAVSTGSTHALLGMSERAQAHARRAKQVLEDCAVALRQPRTAQPEIIASGIRAALDELGRIVGTVDADAVIGRVFSRFCIGK